MDNKTMKLPSFKSSSSWPWPAYCHQPRTLSFSTTRDSNIFKTLNSVYNSDLPSPPLSPTSSADDPTESLIQGLRSDRLFFKPGETKSILEEAKTKGVKPENESDSAIKESVLMTMDSEDPYVDFRSSMKEMVDAHGFRDWESLEELLSCYLKANDRDNHGFIIAAFVDLLVSLARPSSSSPAMTTTTCCSSGLSPSSPMSFYTSSNFSDDSSSTPCVSSLQQDEDDDGDGEIKHN